MISKLFLKFPDLEITDSKNFTLENTKIIVNNIFVSNNIHGIEPTGPTEPMYSLRLLLQVILNVKTTQDIKTTIKDPTDNRLLTNPLPTSKKPSENTNLLKKICKRFGKIRHGIKRINALSGRIFLNIA